MAATPETGTPTATTSGSDGVYVLRLEPGVYTVAATAYGYYPYTHSGVEVTSATTTTLNVPLTPIPSYVVSGTITDAQTGWPLYAHLHDGQSSRPPGAQQRRVDRPGQRPLQPDVVGGDHLHAEGRGLGCRILTRHPLVLAPLDGQHDVRRGIARGQGRLQRASAIASTASGRRNPSRRGTLPAGWSLIDNAGTGGSWRFDDPKPRGNRTGGTGSFAILDSDYAGFRNVDAILRSPAMDFSGETTVILEFKYDFRWYMYGLNEVADVDDLNDGTTWTNVWRRSGADDRGPETARAGHFRAGGGTGQRARPLPLLQRQV